MHPIRSFFLTLLAALVLLAGLLLLATAAPVRADTLRLTGVLLDGDGRPRAGEGFRLVLGSDPVARNPRAWQMITTDAQGRFALTAPVELGIRRVQVNTWNVQQAPFMEIGIATTLADRPVLHWVTVEFLSHGARRGISTFVPDAAGDFARRLTYHSDERTFSFPDDPRAMRLTSTGFDFRINTYNAGEGGIWQLDVTLTRHDFQMR